MRNNIKTFDIHIFVCLYAYMRTTVILNSDLKKQAQLKALQEGKTLSQVINNMLHLYIKGLPYHEHLPKKTMSLRESLNTGELGFKDAISRDFIYELPK